MSLLNRRKNDHQISVKTAINTSVDSEKFKKSDNIVINLLLNFLIPILLVFGFYIHFLGDIIPGGGFQSGVIFASIFILYKLINLTNNKFIQVSNSLLNKIGIVGATIYLVCGLYPVVFKKNIFEYVINNDNINWNMFFIFFIEIGIALVIFSSLSSIFNVLLILMKEKGIFNKD